MRTKELITAYYAAFNRRDFDSFLTLLSEDVEHNINQGRQETGKHAFRDFMTVMDEHYREEIKDLVVMVSADESRAAAEFSIEGTYLKSQVGLPPAHGQKYRIPVGAFFTIRDGKIRRVTNYYNLEDWIAQVSR